MGRGVAALSPQRQRSDIIMSSSNFVERFLFAKTVGLFLLIPFENLCVKGGGLGYILAFLLCKAHCRPVAFGPILRPFLDSFCRSTPNN